MKIVVNGDGKTVIWNIPKALLKHHSGFFVAACDGRHGAACKDEVSVNGSPPSVFEIFVQWLYTSTFPTERIDNDGEIWPGFYYWLLGNVLAAEAFKDRAMLYIHQFSGLQNDFDNNAMKATSWCLTNTIARSGLRCYFLDALARYWIDPLVMEKDKTCWKELFDEHDGLCKELLFAITKLDFTERPITTIKPPEEYLENV